MKKNGNGFHINKLECVNCTGTLTIAGKIATCEFCSSQFYLEGYSDYGYTNSTAYHDHGYSNPYLVDGGVSLRRPNHNFNRVKWDDTY